MASHLRRRSLNLETNGSAAADPRLGVQVPPLTAPHPHRAPGSGQGKGTGAQEGTESGPAPPRPAPQSQVRRWPGSIRVWRWGAGPAAGQLPTGRPWPRPHCPASWGPAGSRSECAVPDRLSRYL